MLTEYDHLPPNLLSKSANELHEVLPGPSLIHLPGERAAPLFVAVLLHGNEVTGWEAVRQVLLKYRDRVLPRAMSLLIGNVAAAKEGKRCLPGQPDYNRIWKGEAEGPEGVMVRQVLERMRERQVFACVDIHNNTGRNPHYACLNRLEQPFFHLARLFSRTVVYFLNPDSVLSRAFAALCPAVTAECGRPSEPHGVAHAAEYIESCLHLSAFPQHPIHPQDIDLFHTVAVVKVEPAATLAIEDDNADISLPATLDRLNFCELKPGTPLAQVRRTEVPPIQVWDEVGRQVTERFFAIDDDRLVIKTAVMPSMLTLKTDIIQQDCLCYLMERLPLMETV